MPQAAGVPAARSKLARMESRAVPEVTILAEGVDGWRDGVCSLDPGRHPLPSHPIPFLPRFPVTPNDYRKVISRISTGTLRVLHDSMPLALFRAHLEIEPLPPRAAKMG